MSPLEQMKLTAEQRMREVDVELEELTTMESHLKVRKELLLKIKKLHENSKALLEGKPMPHPMEAPQPAPPIVPPMAEAVVEPPKEETVPETPALFAPEEPMAPSIGEEPVPVPSSEESVEKPVSSKRKSR